MFTAECWIISPEISRKDPQWLAFNSQTQLQHLKFSVLATGNLSFVPTDILQSLKYLRTINIEYGHIHELHSFAFGNLTLLMNISLGNNQVKVIGPYTFANHPHLHEINLEKNEIYELDRVALVNLPNLNRLNLDHNRLEVIQDDTFDVLSKLSELLLRNNSISKLTREIFKGLGNLKVLNLSLNKLTFIGDTVFAELWSLQELELENNQIEVSGKKKRFSTHSRISFLSAQRPWSQTQKKLSIQNHFHLEDYSKIKLTVESEGKSFQLRKIKFYLLLGESLRKIKSTTRKVASGRFSCE